MKSTQYLLSAVATCILTSLLPATVQAKTVYEAISGGKASANFNLRYEDVSQSNTLQDANALTLRTRLGYTSDTLNGWSFKIEMEDSRIVLGQGDYSVGPAGYNPGIYSIIADPEVTELDQGFVQYKNAQFTFKLGRQVIILDGHRFIGHVGWRQDRQTFDAATFSYQANEKLVGTYSYITQRNRIFAEQADLDSKDHLLNVSYTTAIGKLVAYSYLLEVDDETDNGIDTYGLSFNGKQGDKDLSWLYHVEFANQSTTAVGNDFDTDYLHLNVGVSAKGYTAKLGYESLGSDNGLAGFSTPLATLHKFNGWADMFLATPAEGLVDLNVSVATSALGGKWLVAYHDYEADEASTSVDDLGSEINAQYTTSINKKYTLGVKYAKYSGESTRPDTDKVWLWLNFGF